MLDFVLNYDCSKIHNTTFLQARLLSKIVILNRDSFLVTLMVDVVHEAIARVCFFAWEVDRITNWIVYWTYLSIY